MAVNRVKGLTIHEMLVRVGEKKTREEKINELREYNSLALRDVLKGAYDDSIQFLLPSGAPPYKEASEESPPNRLSRSTKQFRYFVVGGPGENMPQTRVETMFIRLLESVHPDDAKLIIAMKDKKVAGLYKGVTKKLVSEAFPGLIAR